MPPGNGNMESKQQKIHKLWRTNLLFYWEGEKKKLHLKLCFETQAISPNAEINEISMENLYLDPVSFESTSI